MTAASLINTTPFPNALLDEAMPMLKDTEWRLLCVIARQTLGWRDGQGKRKERDWMTQKQLKARTGRNSAAISQAVEALVARRLIAVSDAAGKPLATVKARRFSRSQVYYGIHPVMMDSIASEENAARYHAGAIVPKSEVVASPEGAKSPRFSETDPRFSRHEARKANRTKENVTKEIWTKEIVEEVFLEKRSGEAPQTRLDLDIEAAEPSDPESERFVEFYRQQFKERIGDAPPPISRDDRQRLQTLLNTSSFEAMAELLDIFFTIGFAYIRRQGYPLSAFVHSINILQAVKPKSGNASGSHRTVTWHQAGAILPEKLQKGAQE